MARAEALGEKTYEITMFLVDIRGYRPKGARCSRTATYHDACAGLRELDVVTVSRANCSPPWTVSR